MLVGKATGLFNAQRVVNLDFSEFKSWAKSSSKQVSEMFTQMTLMNSLRESNINKFDRDTVTYISNTKEGIFVRNFLNYTGPSVYGKLKKTDCYEKLHANLPRDEIFYDPRCRPWFEHMVTFIKNYAKLIKKDVVDETNLRYPIITTAPYAQIDLNLALTYCTFDKWDVKKTMIQNESYMICADIYLDQLTEFMSKAYGSMMVQYLSYLAKDAKVKKLIDDYNKIPEKIDGIKKPFFNWCKEIKKFDSEMSWFAVYLGKDLKYQYLMDVDGFIGPENLAQYKRFDPLIEKLKFTGIGDTNLTNIVLKDATG